MYGKVESSDKILQMSSPEYEIRPSSCTQGLGESLNVGRIVPIYSLPQGLGQKAFRKFIKKLLDEFLPQMQDFLPFDIRSRNNLLNLAKSLLNIHFPTEPGLQKEAFNRLCFEEFFLFQILLSLRKLRKIHQPGISHQTSGKLIDDYITGLGFELTSAQKKVISEIASDMARPVAMQRLLQGDVGSGKTVVAVIASLMAVQDKYQAVFMAPTEILAKQHYEKISCQQKIKVGLLTAGLPKKEKEKILQQIKNGEIDIIIGTHALLEQKVEFKNLGLVVIDEQHKFGVGQRALLLQKGPHPDVLIMTATPIPRTLAITLYGDLDISVINEMPLGRIPIKTSAYNFEERDIAYRLAKNELACGHQVFVVYPVIEDPALMDKGWVDISGAKKMYEELKKDEFKEYGVGLIHGRLKEEEQDRVMRNFKAKKLQVLVATTVLEVGIDIPAATCMIIEHAQRFGLAQLHQLRGRVGRAKFQSYCFLISGAQTEESRQRIQAMVGNADGFSIAEEDLKIRGPGEFFGSRQSGLSELKIANPLTQMHLLKKAREEAVKLVSADAQFSGRNNILLKEKLLQRFPEYEKLMVIG